MSLSPSEITAKYEKRQKYLQIARDKGDNWFIAIVQNFYFLPILAEMLRM